MPPIIVSSSGDDANFSDTIEAHKRAIDKTVPGKDTIELSTELAGAVQAPLSTRSFPLSAMSTTALTDQCIYEINRYHQGERQRETYCVELLRRTTLQDDLDAWQALQQCLFETVLRWLDDHPRRETVYRLDKEEHYATQTFERFYQATVHQQVAFSTLADALLSLRAYLNSVILDALRASSGSCGIHVPRCSKAEQSGVTSSKQGEVWDMLKNMLSDVREQRVIYLLFHCGLRPKDIVRTYPQEFQEVEEISCLRRRLIKRLLDSEDSLD